MNRLNLAVRGTIRCTMALACSLLIGCGSHLTYERWQSVHEGMSPAQVQSILGQPWQTTAQSWVYYDETREVAVMVWYGDDKVIGTTWQSPEYGLQGQRPMPWAEESDDDAPTAPAFP